MADMPTVREVLLEMALRAALRRLDGVLHLDAGDTEPRSHEGAVEIERDPRIPSRLTVTLPGVLTRDDCETILAHVDAGDDPIVACDDWFRDAPLVRFRSRAGHEVTVFVDCQGWDYIERIVHADGRRWEYGDTWIRMDDEVGAWEPREPERWGLCELRPYGLTGDRRAMAKVPRIGADHG